jgi:hypothetical protein
LCRLVAAKGDDILRRNKWLNICRHAYRDCATGPGRQYSLNGCAARISPEKAQGCQP